MACDNNQNMNGKISAVLNTYNASRYLEKVIESLAGFDEIVVCDMESTDRTVDIAKNNGCKVVTFKKGNISICEPARNTAIQSASNEWVLVVDADEIVTPQLRDYLYQRINKGSCPEGLLIPRRNKFLGRYTHSSPDYQLRFFRKDKADWPPVIHCKPRIEGTVEKIPNNLDGVHILHLDDASITERLKKINDYTDFEVPKREDKNYSWFVMFFRPFWWFVRIYLIHGGIRDGMRGLIRACMGSVYQIILLSKIKESRWLNGQDDKTV